MSDAFKVSPEMLSAQSLTRFDDKMRATAGMMSMLRAMGLDEVVAQWKGFVQKVGCWALQAWTPAGPEGGPRQGPD